MAKLEWGKKRICLGCSLKYYDFNKSPIKCPSCSLEFDPDSYLKNSKAKSVSPKATVAVDEIVDTQIDEEEIVIDDDEVIKLIKDEDEDEDEDGGIDIVIDDDISFVDEDDDNSHDVISKDVIDEEKE
ncbi:TIGR02300 family protein [Alphaproteobacteria bacterium]|nr:TIGR02300 family protein [Alphaproteobacteria bacterium]